MNKAVKQSGAHRAPKPQPPACLALPSIPYDQKSARESPQHHHRGSGGSPPCSCRCKTEKLCVPYNHPTYHQNASKQNLCGLHTWPYVHTKWAKASERERRRHRTSPCKRGKVSVLTLLQSLNPIPFSRQKTQHRKMVCDTRLFLRGNWKGPSSRA